MNAGGSSGRDGGSVRFESVCIGHPGRHLVHELDGVIGEGARIALTGVNGSGKSTLLRVLARDLKPLFGSLAWSGWGRRDVAYMPQASTPDRTVRMSAFDLALSGLWRRIGPFRAPSKADLMDVEAALDAVGIAAQAHVRLDQLSGGEMQRLLFARAGLQDARLILLDEPFSAVDRPTTTALLDIIQRWSDEGRAVVAAVHDPALLPRFAQRLDLIGGHARWSAIASEPALRLVGEGA